MFSFSVFLDFCKLYNSSNEDSYTKCDYPLQYIRNILQAFFYLIVSVYFIKLYLIFINRVGALKKEDTS